MDDDGDKEAFSCSTADLSTVDMINLAVDVFGKC